MIVADTNVLSTFARVGAIDLLRQIMASGKSTAIVGQVHSRFCAGLDRLK